MLHSYERCDENVVVYSSRIQIYFLFPKRVFGKLFFCDGIVHTDLGTMFRSLVAKL